MIQVPVHTPHPYCEKNFPTKVPLFIRAVDHNCQNFLMELKFFRKMCQTQDNTQFLQLIVQWDKNPLTCNVTRVLLHVSINRLPLMIIAKSILHGISSPGSFEQAAKTRSKLRFLDDSTNLNLEICFTTAEFDYQKIKKSNEQFTSSQIKQKTTETNLHDNSGTSSVDRHS